jgi:hypothetical protein
MMLSKLSWCRWTVVLVLMCLLSAGGVSLLLGGKVVVVPGGSVAQADEEGRSFNDPPHAVTRRASDDAIDRLLDAVRVDEAIRYRGLTVFPITLRKDYADFVPRTFDEAVERGDLRIQEKERAQVNTVRVRNEGSRPVFIMAGEIMSGSRQDRTVRRDALIPADSGWVDLSVYCVEAGRWTLKTPYFGSRQALASPALRADAYAGAGQQRIWDQVDEAAKAQGVEQSGDRAFQEIYDSPAVRDRVQDYVDNLRVPRDRDVVGLVAYSHGIVVGADLFGSPNVFARLRDKLIRSYVLTVDPRGGLGDDTPSMQDAARFLARAWSERCQRLREESIAAGDSFRLHSRDEDTGGAALLYREDAVHVSLFPEREFHILPYHQGGDEVPVPRLRDF